MIKWKTQFSAHDAQRYGKSFSLPSKAKQAPKDAYNPNAIMKVFKRNGDLGIFTQRKGYYADISHLSTFSSYADVQASMQPILDAFYSLPAIERERFSHDPMKFLDFAKNPANLKWLEEQGFVSVNKPTQSELSGSPTDGDDGASDEKLET